MPKEYTCGECPHYCKFYIDNDKIECPARKRERELTEVLEEIARFDQGEYWSEVSIDEPWAAKKAREILGRFKREP